MIDPTFQEIEQKRERMVESAGAPSGRVRCPRCRSDDVSDRQGHVRPDGDDTPPWLLVCEDCGHEWEEND
jgi:DNA-directed RNA polymerase subunit M/transcription elongation factor TFIIS